MHSFCLFLCRHVSLRALVKLVKRELLYNMVQIDLIVIAQIQMQYSLRMDPKLLCQKKDV